MKLSPFRTGGWVRKGTPSMAFGSRTLQELDPLCIGQNVQEVIECDLAAENDARAL